MITFKNYLKKLEEETNVHQEHIEDLVFNLGVEGTRKAIFFMRDIRDMLSSGCQNKKSTITVKYDGSPAVVMGVNPENNKFFVAKKGIFNKNPKLYYSHSDIDFDTSGDLADKLKNVFTECSKLGLTSGVYQGDVMFSKDSLKIETIDGEKYITFHPNTIVYAVPENSLLGRKIKQSNIGIVWHTIYTGDTLSSLSAKYGESITRHFKDSRTSWMMDATFEDASGQASFTKQEKEEFNKMLSEIGKLFQAMPSQLLNYIHKDDNLLVLINVFNNTVIRRGDQFPSPIQHTDNLYKFLFDRFEKEKESKKTDKSKNKVDEKRDKILNFFTSHSKGDIARIFNLSFKIAEAKQYLINKLNNVTSMKHFLKTSNGFKVTNPEGFVAISDDQKTVKLVDRFSFSHSNFSPEILKGWTKN